MIGLLKAIHDTWAGSAALCAIIPAASVYTGPARAASPPWCVVSIEDREPVARPNDGSAVDKFTVRFTAHHASHDSGALLIAAVRAAYDRSTFTVGSSDRCLLMRRAGEEESKEPDGGPWKFTLDFECRVEIAAGVEA